MSRTTFYGPKDVRAIEVRLYLYDNPETPAYRSFLQSFQGGVGCLLMYLYCIQYVYQEQNWWLFKIDLVSTVDMFHVSFTALSSLSYTHPSSLS